jgi:hypothetical protein
MMLRLGGAYHVLTANALVPHDGRNQSSLGHSMHRHSAVGAHPDKEFKGGACRVPTRVR